MTYKTLRYVLRDNNGKFFNDTTTARGEWEGYDKAKRFVSMQCVTGARYRSDRPCTIHKVEVTEVVDI